MLETVGKKQETVNQWGSNWKNRLGDGGSMSSYPSYRWGDDSWQYPEVTLNEEPWADAYFR